MEVLDHDNCLLDSYPASSVPTEPILDRGGARMSKHKGQEERNEQDRTLIINVNLTRGSLAWLAVVLAAVAFLGLLAFGETKATAGGGQAAPAGTTGMRQFYLETDSATGATADTVCEEGYHMASLWEILDPSNLKYNTDLGYVWTDSGSGPPTLSGWVRTGYAADDEDVAGRGNCDAWTTDAMTASGTMVQLPNGMWDPHYADLHVWYALTDPCNSYNSTWCVED
jgi:hypothetical protein